MRYLRDTNVISEMVARRPNKEVLEWVGALEPESVYLSVVTIGEIRKGIEKLEPSERKDALLDWLTSDLLIRFSGRIAAVTTEVMLSWGALTGRPERVGRPLAAVDSLIAAIALEGEFVLVTRNEQEFSGTGVKTQNPWKSP